VIEKADLQAIVCVFVGVGDVGAILLNSSSQRVGIQGLYIGSTRNTVPWIFVSTLFLL